MSLPANPRRDRYVANAGQTVFPYTFRIFAATDLVVERLRGTTTTTLQLNVDYTVSGVGNNTGGNVTLTQGAEQDDIIAIVSNQPNQRSTDFTESGDFRAAALNAEFDRIWIAIQQLAQDVSRQITRPLSDPTASYVLPPAAVRANKYVAFAADGSLAFPQPQPAGPNAAEAYWWGGTAGGTANALTISVAGGPIAYAAGQRYAFVVASNNTGAATLAVNSLGAKSIRRPDGTTLAAGDLVAGTLIGVTYDGTNFRLTAAWVPPLFTSDVTIQKNNPYLFLNKPASGQLAALFGRTAGFNRWGIWLGSTANETGGNTGSDFVIRRYADDGTALSDPIFISRSTGAVTFNHTVTMAQPLTLPASDPTDANHAARKAYVDAQVAQAGVWEKITDAAVSSSTIINITGFSLQNYRRVTVMLLGAQVSAASSTDIQMQIYRGGTLITSGYTRQRFTAGGTGVSANRVTGSAIDLTSSGINTPPNFFTIDIVQPVNSSPVLVFAHVLFYNDSGNLHINVVSGVLNDGSSFADGVRIIAPNNFVSNGSRVVVMGLKP